MRKALCLLLVIFAITMSGCSKTNGKIKINHLESYDQTRVYNCGYALISYYDFNESEHYYFIDTQGNKAFGKEFQSAKPFDEGVTIVQYKSKEYFMDYKGNFISDGYKFISEETYRYEMGNMIETDYCVASTDDYTMYLFKKNGELVFENTFDNYYSGSSTNGPVFTVWDQATNKYGVVNNKGKIILELKYEYLSRVSNGYVIATETEGDTSNIIDLNGNVIVEGIDDTYIEEVRDDLILTSKIIIGGASVKNIYNTKGKDVLKEDYTFKSFVHLNDTYFIASRNNKDYLFDSTGRIVLPEASDELVALGNYLVVINDLQTIVLDKTLTPLYIFENAKVEKIDDNHFGVFYNNNKMTLYDYNFDKVCDINANGDYYSVINDYIVFYENKGNSMKIHFYNKLNNSIKTYDSEGVKLFGVTLDPITLDYYISYSMIENPSSSTFEFKHAKVEEDNIKPLGIGYISYVYDGYLYLKFYDNSNNDKIVKNNKKIFEGRISNNDPLFHYVNTKGTKSGIMRYDGKIINKNGYVNWK